MCEENLSIHDKAILNAIFNPNLPLNDVLDEAAVDLTDYEEDLPEIIKSRKMEADSVKKAENGDLEGALTILNEAIKELPNRASLYNNRAQVYQLKGDVKAAFEDLTKAISLCNNNENINKTKCQAYCQRGMLYRKEEQDDLARKDFQEAANLGNSFAKAQLVELNPYAAMCNQMLQKMISKERGDKIDD